MITLASFGLYLLLGAANASTLGIPTVPFSVREGCLPLNKFTAIIVDSSYAQVVDEKGESLIPPTLEEFSETFADDLKVLGVDVATRQGQTLAASSIFLTLGDPSNYLDVAGRQTAEGYSLSVSSTGITLTGASPLGVWWGTRTILQQAILNNGCVPFGNTIDSPGWSTRGMMLDAARHYYPPEFLIEICSYMSFFKQNTFHLHLSDNLYNNVKIYSRERSLDLHARFRLWSDADELAGLNKHKNESYTRDQFEKIQSSCAQRGVTIVPEIEAPGHALVFVQWKPELGLATDLSLLNISHPDTIPTVKRVWNEFLPWFKCKSVHIGADEYTAGRKDYTTFVNTMADHIRTVANKAVRIWGTFPPIYNDTSYVNIYKNVTIQHWAFFEDNPLFDYIRNDYTVLNSDDTFYVVGKWSGSYPQKINVTATFAGDPATGGLRYPNVFDSKTASNNPGLAEPLVLGHVAPLWNDYGPNATVYSEAYYSWREGIPAVADKQWGGSITALEFTSVLEALHPFIPGQNLERRIHSKSSTIVEYTFVAHGARTALNMSTVVDSSGNSYDGKTDCLQTESGALSIDNCSIETPLSSKGRNYTLTLSLKLAYLSGINNSTLISGGDSSLMLTPNITFFAGGEYFRLNTSLPLHQKVDFHIIGRGNRTFARIDDGSEAEFLTKMGINGERFEWAPMAFEAPLQTIGGQGAGWSGEIYGFKVLDFA